MTIKSSSPKHECETRISTTTVSAVGGREVTRPRKEESESDVKSRLLRRSRQDKRKLSSRREQEEEAAVTGIRRAKMKRRRDRDGTADKRATVESPAEKTRETNKWDERGVERTVEKSEKAKETEETTIKMKNDVLADIPATISLTRLSVVTSYPSGGKQTAVLSLPLSELLVIF